MSVMIQQEIETREVVDEDDDAGGDLSAWKSFEKAMDLQPKELLRLDESSKDGIRGLFLNRNVKAGDVIMSIPLEKCLRDDQPPKWISMQSTAISELNNDDDSEHSDDQGNPYGSSSDWAVRLGASLMDHQLKDFEKDLHTKLWFSFMPDPDWLRASLPIHWDEAMVQNARCTALELAVDTTYFTHATAVQDLLMGLQNTPEASKMSHSSRQRFVENALDVVQTRACRVELTKPNGSIQSLRLLAPIFDFLNHAVPASASFGLEDGNRLVVRALRDQERDQEVTIDYGESARPAWKCLTSYGFVPTYIAPDAGDSGGVDDGVIAEVYMDGVRYEVGPGFIPEDMVSAALDSSLLMNDPSRIGGEFDLPKVEYNVELTPEIAIRLARRISDVAYQLLLDPPPAECDTSRINNFDDDESDNNDNDVSHEPETLFSNRLAATLRWNQHRVLLECSLRLHDWAVQQ